MNKRLKSAVGTAQFAITNCSQRLRALHSNECGTISILTVFTLLMFTMLLMLVFNIAKQHDDKVRMQNGADLAACSGGVVLARGMNAIAFTNHLEAEILAITAILRAAEAAGEQLPVSMLRPSFELILGTPEPVDPTGQLDDRLIPRFQRDVVRMVPQVAQTATDETSLRLGIRQQDLEQLPFQMADPSDPGNREFGAGPRGPQSGVLWHAALLSPVSVDNGYDVQRRTLPVVDPDPHSPLPDAVNLPVAADYLSRARADRGGHATHYLQMWLNRFDPDASLAAEAREELDQLLNRDFPSANVPLMLRDGIVSDDLTFVSVIYRRHVDLLAPRMFRNWLNADAQSFAQLELYLVKPRHQCCPWYWEEPYLDEMGQPRTRIIHNMDALSEWNSFNQNWSSRLVPATSEAIPVVLHENPGGMRTMPLIGESNWKDVNTH